MARSSSVFISGKATPIRTVLEDPVETMRVWSWTSTHGRHAKTALLHPWKGIAPGRLHRAMDLTVSLGLLILTGIPLILLMALIRLESRGPALFRQIRVGQGERTFTLLKLRSMRTDPGGPEITVTRDTRVTRIGRFVRRTSLDELPQLINVLRGEMTLVGPRPETPALAVAYPVHCRWVFAYRPGLTGPSQVRMRDSDVVGPAVTDPIEGYLRLVVPARARIDSRYLACPSFPATFAVMVDTVKHILGMEVRRRD